MVRVPLRLSDTAPAPLSDLAPDSGLRMQTVRLRLLGPQRTARPAPSHCAHQPPAFEPGVHPTHATYLTCVCTWCARRWLGFGEANWKACPDWLTTYAEVAQRVRESSSPKYLMFFCDGKQSNRNMHSGSNCGGVGEGGVAGMGLTQAWAGGRTMKPNSMPSL